MPERLVLQFLIALILFTFLVDIHLADIAYSYTYNDIWWIGGKDANSAAGHLRMAYTYPSEVLTGEEFNVGITLEYLQGVDQSSDWISFPVIIPVLKEIYTNGTYYYDIDAGNATSDLRDMEILTGTDTETMSLDVIKQGEQFSKGATLTAPETNGTYMFGIIFDSFFGPGSSAVSYRWDVTEHYNATWRDHGIIYPESDSPPINIIDASMFQNTKPLIRVELQEPYGRFNISGVSVQKIGAESSNIQSSNRTDSYVEFPVDYNSSYQIEAPAIIEMAGNVTRAAFWGWSDGIISNIRKVTITDQQPSEYYAMYRPQYYLEVASDIGDTQGSGWYNAQEQAQFAVSSLAGIWNLKAFDHWIGDVSGETDIDIPSGFINMDGPKLLQAVWVHDLTYLGIFSGVIVIVTTSVGTVRYFWIRHRTNSSA